MLQYGSDLAYSVNRNFTYVKIDDILSTLSKIKRVETTFIKKYICISRLYHLSFLKILKLLFRFDCNIIMQVD